MKNKGIDLSFANENSPVPGKQWADATEDDRVSQIKNSLNVFDSEWSQKFNVVSAKNNGFVVFEFKDSIPVQIRGMYFLNIENHLTKLIDKSITIWIAPVGDKSSLRNLRGIEVKK